MRKALALVVAAALGTAMFGCSLRPENERLGEYQEYYRQLAPVMSALDRELGIVVTSQAGLEGDALAAGYLSYAAQLDESALALSDFDGLGDVERDHREFLVAFRNLADAKEQQAAALTREPGALTLAKAEERVDGRSGDWFMICHDLQDQALAREIDVDLKCTTALHRR